MHRLFSRFWLIFSAASILMGADAEQFIANDPPPRRVDADEFTIIQPRDAGFNFRHREMTAGENDTLEVFKTLPGAPRLVNGVSLRLSPDSGVAADSIDAVLRIRDESTHVETMVTERGFSADGTLEFRFDGVYSSSFSVALTGAGVTQDLSLDFFVSQINLSSQTRLMPIGDSITYGKYADDLIGYRKTLYDLLTAAGLPIDFVGSYGEPPYEGHFQGSMKINDFYPANLTPNARGRMDVTSAMNNYRPNIVSIHIGTNDLNSETGFPISPYGEGSHFNNTQSGEMATLIDYLLDWHNGHKGSDLQQIIVSLIIPIKYQDSVCVEFIAETARLVNDFRNGRITGENEPVFLCDHFGRFREWPNLVEDGYKALMVDTLHPNTAGHNLMGETLFDLVQTVITGEEKWFADITWYAGIAGDDHHFENQGVAVADIDGDGADEIYTSRTNSNWPQAHETLYMPSDGTLFKDMTEKMHVADIGASRGVLFVDIDNDGDLDLLNGNSSARNRLYENLNGNDFRDITSSAGIADLNRLTTGLAALDVENDGDIDLYAVNSREKNELYINDGSGHFSLQNRGADDVDEPNIPSMSAGAADFDQDGDVDLVIAKRNDSIKLFINDGSGRFSDGAKDAGLLFVASTNSVVWSDMDNDGDLDLLLGCTASSAVPSPTIVFFENQGNGRFNRRDSGLLMDGYSLLASDFDNDGDADILATQEKDYCILYLNLGDWRFNKAQESGAEVHGGDIRGAALIDDDDDGDLDVIMMRSDMLNVFLRNNLDNDNHYLKIDVRGPAGSAAGYGTKIWLYRAGHFNDPNNLLGYQELQASGGHLSQSSPVLHFGLGRETGCDLLAQFSDGSFYAARGTSGDQTLIIAPPTIVKSPQIAASISYVSGDQQTGTVGEILAQPLVVRILDQNSQPLANEPVSFRVVEGDADLFLPIEDRLVVETENGERSATLFQISDSSCSNGGAVFIPSFSAGAGSVRLNLEIVGSASYYPWLRIFNNSGLTSLDVKVDAQSARNMSIPVHADWQWIPIQNLFPLLLDHGSHTITLTFSSPGLQIDQMLLTRESAYQPQGWEEQIEHPELTDERGETRRFVQLNQTAGTIVVDASAAVDDGALSGSPVPFQLTAKAGPAETISEISGNHQSGRAGSRLAEPFVVLVKDVFSNPVANYAVNFQVMSGGGRLDPGSVILTDTNGRASTTLIPGDQAGEQKVSATAPSLVGSPVIFTAMVSGVPSKINLISGNNQTGQVVTGLPQSVRVRVLTSDNQPVASHPLECRTPDAGGRLSSSPSFAQADSLLQTRSDADGYAVIYWQLGKHAGRQSLIINAGNLSDSPMTINANGVAAGATVILKIAGDQQSGVVGSPLAQPFAVRALDPYGNPCSGVNILFKSLQDDGLVGNKKELAMATDADGYGRAIYTLGKKAGVLTVVQVYAGGSAPLAGSPIDFTATALPASPALAIQVSGDDQRGIVQTLLAEPLIVRVTDSYNNPIKGFEIEFRVIEGGGWLDGVPGGATLTNGEGLAQAVYSLGRQAGRQLVAAVCSGLLPERIDFVAEALPSSPFELVYVSGNDQIGAVQSTIDSFRVQVIDEFANAVPGHPVRFEVVGQEGGFNGAKNIEIETDADGMAAAAMTLGATAGDSIDSAIASSWFQSHPLQNSPVHFFASARMGTAQRIIAITPQQGLSAPPFHELREPVRVRVIDEYGLPVVGFSLECTILTGDGHFENQQKSLRALTNSGGEAEIRWTLGRFGLAQKMRVIAAVNGKQLINSPLIFNAEVVIATPHALEAVSDVNISAAGGEWLPSPLTVQVVDEFGDSFAGHEVIFSLVKGVGSFMESPNNTVQRTSDENGFAAVHFKCGSLPSADSIYIHARSFNEEDQELQGSPIVFRISAATSRVVIVSGNNQQGVVNTRLPSPLRVRAMDEKNNPLSHIPLTFTIHQGSGSIIGEPHQTTDSAGEAAISFQFGEKSGRCVVGVASEQLLGTAIFTLHALPEAAVRIRIAGGNQQTGIAGHRLNQMIEVQALDRYNNGVPNVAVLFIPRSNHGMIIPSSVTMTDSIGVVRAEWTLGLDVGEQSAVAESEGLTPALIFKAFALANQAPQLFLPDSLEIGENHHLQLSIAVDDAENDSIFITGLNLPNGAVLDQEKKLFSWTPDYTQAGRYAPVFYAADAYNARSLKVVPIIVSNTNRPPLIDLEDSRPSEHQLGRLRTPAALDFFLAADDPDHDPLKYLWQVNGRLMTTSNTFRLQTQTLPPGKTTVQAFVYDREDTATTTWVMEIVTSVELSTFSAQFAAFRGGSIKWSTRNEWNHVGFYVERSEREDGRYEIISPLIPSSPSHTYEFLDAQVEAGNRFFYRLVSVSRDGAVTTHESVPMDVPLPSAYILHPNFPNPFNAGTILQFELPKAAPVQVEIYDLLGRRVTVLQDALLQAGYHRLTWDGRDEKGSLTASGIYYAVVSNGPDRVICKMMQLR